MHRFFPLVCAVLSAGAVAVAALQYHWTAELRRMEIERLRFALRSAGASFVREASLPGRLTPEAAAHWFRDSPVPVHLEVRDLATGAVRLHSGAARNQGGEPLLVMPFSSAVAFPAAEPGDVMVRVPFRGPELVLRVWAAGDGSLEAVADAHRNSNLALSLIALGLVVAAGLVAIHAASSAAETGRRQVELVAAVSHELKTPVSVIRSAAQNLSCGIAAAPDQVRQYGELIESSAQRLAKTLGRVLTIAAAPQRGARRDVVDIGGLLRDFSGVEVRCDGPVCVYGDLEGIRAALEDLVSNARKHARNSGRVVVRAERASGRRVLVAVEDDGPGIPEAELALIFEPFRRGTRAVRERVEGSGLGLYLVAAVARAHGGEVRVRSSVEGGSVFVLDLPEARLA